jgi:Rrf2 family transcriptional regulator, cysteine metabolism repressor
MRLSAKVEYACLAALELAVRYQKNVPVQLAEIAGAQDIPEKFLTQIFQRIKAANIVNSARGVSGGYFLARRPSEITLADIIRAVDNTLLGSYGDDEIMDGSRGREIVLRSWCSISDCVTGQLEQVTLENLVNRMSNEQLNYQI